MTALEARTQSANSWNNIWDRIYQVNIQSIIKEAVSKGNFSCTIPYLSHYDVSNLTNAGFKVTNKAYNLWEVSW